MPNTFGRRSRRTSFLIYRKLRAILNSDRKRNWSRNAKKRRQVKRKRRNMKIELRFSLCWGNKMCVGCAKRQKREMSWFVTRSPLKLSAPFATRIGKWVTSQFCGWRSLPQIYGVGTKKSANPNLQSHINHTLQKNTTTFSWISAFYLRFPRSSWTAHSNSRGSVPFRTAEGIGRNGWSRFWRCLDLN